MHHCQLVLVSTNSSKQTNMFKYVLFAALLAFASAKPLVVDYPVAYTAPVAAAYTAPVAYSAYSAYSPVAYSAYTYASPYSYYVR
ncbi:neuropeptide-like 4 [Manduca sexta]|uniref:Uncharacterized protein n=1 Tax=Manduca sexta TaxID=7130 RepID=A0A922CDX0_MANSE|nr:neuropeptide-like 4 [Manduca sexta]KAG6442279.1 hypothetical protein O3G_MSEX002176 [Manduca sexta]